MEVIIDIYIYNFSGDGRFQINKTNRVYLGKHNYAVQESQV